MMIMLEPFRASKWIEEHKKLEAEEAGSGDLRVLNSVYYSISSELMDAGYLDFVEDELPPTAEPAMNFLSYAALWVSRGKTIASMSKRNALADAVIKAFPQPTPSSTSSNAAYKSTESLTTEANGVLTLKAFRDEVQTANTLPMIETYSGEGDKVSAIKWKSDVEDQSGPMGSPIVTFYYAKRTCDAVSWKGLTGKDFENLSRDYTTYRKALKTLWNRALSQDTQAAREDILMQWSALKQNKNESVSAFSTRVLDMQNERELIDMEVSDDEVKARFRRGLGSSDLALWALDRANLPLAKFMSLVVGRANEMARLGITSTTDGPVSTPSTSGKQKTCKVFARTGHCKFGDRCRYEHIANKDITSKEQFTPSVSPPTMPSSATSSTTGPSTVTPNAETKASSTPTAARQVICFLCKKPGHIAKDCPSRSKAGNNKSSTSPSPLKAATDIASSAQEATPANDVVGAISFENVESNSWNGTKLPLVVASPSSTVRTSSFDCLADTGAHKNYLSKAVALKLCDELAVTTVPLCEAHVSKQVDGTPLVAKASLKLRVSVGKLVPTDPVLTFYILDNMSPSAIIGIKGMQKLRLQITLSGDTIIRQCGSPYLSETSFVSDESGDDIAVVEEQQKDNDEINDPTVYCHQQSRQDLASVRKKKDLSFDEALQALMEWQPVRSAPDYSFRVRPIGKQKKDSDGQRYYFEVYIPKKGTNCHQRRKYVYSTTLISRLSSTERAAYFAEVDEYLRRGWWQVIDDNADSTITAAVDNSGEPPAEASSDAGGNPIIIFPVRQEGRGTAIRPCADCREANREAPTASYRGDSISRLFRKIRVQWHRHDCLSCIDARKAFYRVHLFHPIPVCTNSSKFRTLRMSFGLAIGCAGLESALLAVLSLARIRYPFNDVLKYRTDIYVDDICFSGSHAEVEEARKGFIETASEFGFEFGKFKDLCPIRDSLGPILHLGLIWYLDGEEPFVRCRHNEAVNKLTSLLQQETPLTKRRCFAISGLAIDSVVAHGPLSVAADVLRSISGRHSGDWDSPLRLGNTEETAVKKCIDIIKEELTKDCKHGFASSNKLDFKVTSDASPYGYGWQVTGGQNKPLSCYEHSCARIWRQGQRHWHINRQELFSLCDAALFVDELVTDALAVGKACTVSFQVDSNAAARWVQNNKVLCKTLERHAINRLVGIYSDLSQEWRRHKVPVSVEKIKGESNVVSDKLSRLVYEHGLVEALYGTDTQIDNFPDVISAVGDGIGQAPSDDLKPTLKAPAEAECEDLTNLYDNLLLFRAFRSWKAARHDVGTKELTTQNGERARRWLRDWQRGSHSLRGVFDRVLQRPSSISRYSGVKAYGGPYYSMTADGILVELRYPYGDILAIPNECYLLPTDDMSIIGSIILFYHEKGGHTNSRHTRWRIGRSFRWPHMRRDIERVCRRCVRCQFVAAYRRSRSIKRHLDTSARFPWQVISIDLLGPLKADVFRMQYVLVAICHLSRFVVLSALKDASTRSVVDALHDIWCLWGRPVVLRADNGPAFRGQFKRQMSSEGIRTQSVSRYSPWSNGVCERVMSTVKGFISGLNKSDTRRWSRFIPVVARRLNTKPLPEGKSPFEILFGRPYPEELETRLSAEEDSSQIDLTPDNEAARNLQLQQKLVVSEVLEDRERRDSPQDPNRVPSQPPVGSTVIRVPPSDRSGRLRQDKTIYEVVRLGGDGVTTYVRPVRSAVDADNNDDDSDVVREHCSNLKRFWGASCESPNS